jgi:hypothetical protein
MMRALDFTLEVLLRTPMFDLCLWVAGFFLLIGILLLVVSILCDISRHRRDEREAGVRRLMEGLSADSHLTICRHGVAGHRPCPECWEWLSQIGGKDRKP